MFEIKRYKKNARLCLKKRRGLFAFAFFLSALIILAFVPSGFYGKNSLPALYLALFVSVCGISANAIARLCFVCVRFGRERAVNFNLYLEGVEDWGRATLAAFSIAVKSALWSLLFVIPGIVSLFGYSLTFFLLAEYKSLSPVKAVKISAVITRGFKGDLFLLLLSFLPHLLFSLLTFGIGFLWVFPYISTAFTAAYIEIKNAALERHIITIQDLRGK